MKSVLRKTALAALVSACMSGLAYADAEYLADFHTEMGGCENCHASEQGPTDDNLKYENSQCVSCHGDLKEVAANDPKDIVSPHSSHLIGDIACTSCHKGHEKSVAYCDACHSFGYDMPFQGKWERKFVPVDADKKAQDQAIAAGPTESTDVVVIGSGGAGLAAAVAARNDGASVILLEKEPIPGGNTKLAAGGMNAAETKPQAKLGIQDKKSIMIEDTMKGGRNLNDPELVKVLANNSSDSIDWLMAMGADMNDVGRMGGASVNRSHRPTGGAGVGAEVAQVLWDAAIERGTDIRLNSRVVRILEAGGKVTGVLVKGEHTGYYVIKSDAVVLATGGFARNNERVAKYDAKLKGFAATNHPGATGDGLDVAMQAGAATRDLQYIQAHPTYSPVGGVMVTEAVRGNGAILINREGNRFVNEITTRDKASAAILAQKGASAYLVFDDSVRKSLSKIEGYVHLHIVEEGKTLADLAKEMGVPAKNLETSVAAYNKSVKAGKDEQFGRPNMPRELNHGPYYAIEVKPAVHHTMGGVVIDTKGEVKDAKGNIIKGLYAAGEITGGVHGANRLGGNAISDIVTFGRIAGKDAAQYAEKAGK
ncbi:fumarate reductase flavoprotein subunit FccA [Shewanella submarina]|uniref:Fumarate reductase n=1 Tax=Shewanella submarina TaxID=2016376 RepID=A0ABV7GMC2_9GAMM|nr:fumarate reductase flavoprotein subunit FccA [Shewanella submarina]MCL1035933.1 fumarate reductase flavoprotein subunit FccA [Shewanella submarina]